MKRIALLFGVDHYDDAYFTSLRGASRDASELSAFLSRGLPANERFETRFFANPSAGLVIRELERAVAALDDDSAFVFYFAGHGLRLGTNTGQSLLCSDASKRVVNGSVEHGTISPTFIADVVREGRGNMFFILDVCRTPAVCGRAAPTLQEGSGCARDVIASVQRTRADGRPANCWILSSCEDGQQASDDGVFVGALIRTMENYLADGTDILLGDDFVERVEHTIRLLDGDSRQRPVADGRRFALTSCFGSRKRLAFDSDFRVNDAPCHDRSADLYDENRIRIELETKIRKDLRETPLRKLRKAPLAAVTVLAASKRRLTALQTSLNSVCHTLNSWLNYTSWKNTDRAGRRRTLCIAGEKYGFRACPAGSFLMGSPTCERERHDNESQHGVTLTSGFWILETPCVQRLWTAVMGRNPSRFPGNELPVERVSWHDCLEFLTKLNQYRSLCPKLPAGYEFRLPTEAEWEYACRAGTTTPYSWGDSLNGSRANCNGGYPYGDCEAGPFVEQTTPVKTYKANPWGIFDMHGNVWEWTADSYGSYPLDDVVNPTAAYGGTECVRRGGGWINGVRNCRSAYRSYHDSSSRSDSLGFRFVLSKKL